MPTPRLFCGRFGCRAPLALVMIWLLLAGRGFAETPPEVPLPLPSVIETLLLHVESRPPGATLYLDGERLGVTPFTVGRVKVGNHALRLEKESFNPVTMDLELNEDTVVDLTLDALLPAATPQAEGTAAKPVAQTPRAPEIDKLLAEADKRLQADQLTRPKGENALEIFQKVLKLAADLPEAKQGIVRVVERLLAMARDDLDNWRLSRPPGENALEKYRAILQIDADNPLAKAGLEEIVDRLLTLARHARGNGKKVEAYLRQAEEVLPGLPRIAETRASLTPKGMEKSTALQTSTSHN
ncbi:MAG: PEGA domain-containing protein [Magnetococcales bacterium]|nr:PEGA domain-containing protein [Magnetococcales bacterium]